MYYLEHKLSSTINFFFASLHMSLSWLLFTHLSSSFSSVYRSYLASVYLFVKFFLKCVQIILGFCLPICHVLSQVCTDHTWLLFTYLSSSFSSVYRSYLASVYPFVKFFLKCVQIILGFYLPICQVLSQVCTDHTWQHTSASLK